jgi:hypothetical protein
MDYTLGGLLTFLGKVALSLIIVTSSSKLFGRQLARSNYFGVSQVFKAQVYQRPSLKSTVLAHINRGERVTVHQRNFTEQEIENKLEDQNIDKYEEKLGFYEVITKNGTLGYVEKAHIHLIYRDFRDQHYHFNSDRENDLTDYRLTEPLTPHYPLAKKNSFRLNFQARLGPSFVDNYVFPQLIKKERFSNRYGAAITFLKNAEFDFEDRFYFGGVVKFLTFKNEFTLINDSEYREDHFGITIGPTLYYESVRLNKMSISHGLELNFIYRRAVINAKSASIQEDRKFDGYMVEPTLCNQISFQNEKKNLDFNLGMRISARPKYELKSTTPSESITLWGNRDGFYELEAKLYQTYFMGVQVYY